MENYIPTKMNSGEYIQIDDIIKYANEIKKQLLVNIHSKYEEIKDKYESLLKLKEDVKEMIELYKLEYLRDIYIKINEQINTLIEQEEKKKKEEQERINKVHEEEAKEKERINKVREEEAAERNTKMLEKQEEEAKERELRRKNRSKESRRGEPIERKENEGKDDGLEAEAYERKEECKCGIKLIHICTCNNSKYEKQKINGEDYCTNCKCWKDRCSI
jgi:hypothetical protein